MKHSKAVKITVCFAALATLFWVPVSSAKAEDNGLIEHGIAGIAYSLGNYYEAVNNDLEGSADKALTSILKTEIVSPYSDLGVSIADSYVNVRSEPSTESEVVGKLYRGCAAEILERLAGDWVKIKSGDVEGYIASNYLAIGKDAETMIDEYATKTVTVKATTLNVRKEQSTDSKILTQIPVGEDYIVTNEYDQWVEILLGMDEDTGKEYTGFVSKDYVSIDVEFKEAISIEEENRIKKAQEEAERAERERKARLAAEEKAKKEEAARLKAEAAAEKANSSSSGSSKNSSSTTSGNSGDLATVRNEIITYAKKFVGNSYVWGGTSLTNGADCSGFVQSIYRDFGYSIPRVSRDQAASAGIKVSLSDRKPGDLIFYTNSYGTVNHVAMYIGNDLIVHAANSREGIKISQYNYRDVYRIRRIVH